MKITAFIENKATGNLTGEQGFAADDFQHEQSLVFEVEKGLVILNSCCHGGVDNIIEEVMETFHGKGVVAVIGGFHLTGSTGIKSISEKPEDVRALEKRLYDLNVRYLLPYKNIK